MAGKSSGTLRRAIGLAKSFLVEKLEDQKKDSKEDVTKFDEEELVEFLKQTHQDHEQIRIQVEKIQGYEDEWDQMILRDPREVEVKANYITKYGSYMAQVETGHKQMQDMEAKYREAWDRLNAKDATKAEELFTPEELVTVKGKKAEDDPRMRTLSESSKNDGTNAKQQMNGQAAECPRIILCEARIMERQDQEIQGQKMDQSNAQRGAINVNQPEQKMLNNGPMMMTMSPFHFAMPQWKKLRKLPDITNSTSPAALQEFYINAQMIFNELMSLGCEMDNLSTADAIESKLPFRVVRKAYTQGCRDTPYKAKFAGCNQPTNEQRTTTMAVQNRHGQGKNSMNNRQKEKVKKPCKYCVEERMMHHPMDCRKYATNEERKVRAGQLQLCFKCLEAGHVARDCSWKCKECQGKHHFTMCHKREQQGQGRQQHPRNAGHRVAEVKNKY
ncbi:Protein CBG08953 [Caenorhabditis briggsae]|uniref:Protein CBG08953 n=1 Tax=Caenorhabditis briggsae TaxID=6238 RepID=A8X7R1_CAEBR|nr:Protein CBG08953 [Caenorhabditis briggsae]CAP28672.2 Protein CBG08953 [Caenorhabditis briggsae]